jgi:hypothetical protein
MRHLKKLLVLLPLLAVLWFCRKPTQASWDTDLVLPVVSSELNIKNFLGDSVFKSDNTGLLNLAVTRTITAIQLDSLIKVPDTTIVNSFTIPCFNCVLTPGQTFTQFPPSELTFSIGNNAAIKRIDVKSGALRVRYTNDTKQPLVLMYIIPNAKKNGQSLSFTETVPPLPDSLVKIYDLTDYSFNMTGLTGNKYNTIAQTYTMMISPTAPGNDTVFFGQGATVKLSYKNLVPNYIEGYFGQQEIDIKPDTTKLDILKSFEASNFILSDANLSFKIVNEFGAEFTANLNGIKSINGNSVVTLATTQLSNLNINSATKVGTTVFPSVHSVSFTPNNSNILPFLSNLPEKLAYQGSVSVNPLGNVSGYNNFAFYGTGIKVLADINIPLRFSANYLKLISTTKVDFAGVSQLDKVNSGKFVVAASNGYPFTARLQAYMLDDNMQVIDSLFVPGNNQIDRGQIDNNNKVTFPTISRLEIPIDAGKINNLKKCKQLKIVSYILMPPNPPDIPIYDNYEIDITITAELNYRVQT